MRSITESVQNFLILEGIKFERMSQIGALKIGFAGENGIFLGFIKVNENRRIIEIDTFSPVRAPSNKRLQTAELLMRVNNKLVLGGFNVDMDSGMITYSTSIILGKSILHNDILEHLLFANWIAMDKFFPAITMVVFNNVLPKKAVRLIRRQSQSISEDPEEKEPVRRFNGRLGDISGRSLN